jgi:hypothetical protein
MPTLAHLARKFMSQLVFFCLIQENGDLASNEDEDSVSEEELLDWRAKGV